MTLTLIDPEKMRERLLTVDEVREKLEVTEGLSEQDFSTNGDSDVEFYFPNGWQNGLSTDNDGLTPTPARVSIDGIERQLTLDAALQAGSILGVGMGKSFIFNSPGYLTEANMNHWYKNGDKNLKLLARDNGVAFTRATINPFSNTAILDAALQGIQEKYGTDDVLVDYKFHHDMDKTSMRLIVPSAGRNIGSARAFSESDPWSVGLDITNSIIGAHPLELRGYMFAWWCTNGSTSTHVASGKYRRKPTADVSDAYEWTRSVVDDVLGGLEHELESVERLTQIPLEGELNTTLGELFEEFDIPANLRAEIIDNLIEAGDLTAYGLMNAITAAANGENVSPGAIIALLNAGGNISHKLAERCEVCHKW